MDIINQIQAYCLVSSLMLVMLPLQTTAETSSGVSTINLQQTASKNTEEQHGFDFAWGEWKSHILRRLHPLTGSKTWVQYDGITLDCKVWDGRANLAQLEADGPAGHIEFLSLRLYNPQTSNWSLNVANSQIGVMDTPTVGQFRNGRGVFYDKETYNGRPIVVRFIISDITPTTAHYEQAFSDDDGKTWETNWIATDTRINRDVSRNMSRLYLFEC